MSLRSAQNTCPTSARASIRAPSIRHVFYLARNSSKLIRQQGRNRVEIRRRTKGPRTVSATIVPNQVFTRDGFGTIRVPTREWRSRIAATSFTLDIIKTRKIPDNALQMHQSIRMVRDMFRRVHAGDSYDWFSTSRLLGHPSAELSKSLFLDLAAIRGFIRARDAILLSKTIDRFEENFGDEMLENYLRMTVSHGHLVREEGWAYVLWSPRVATSCTSALLQARSSKCSVISIPQCPN